MLTLKPFCQIAGGLYYEAFADLKKFLVGVVWVVDIGCWAVQPESGQSHQFALFDYFLEGLIVSRFHSHQKVPRLRTIVPDILGNVVFQIKPDAFCVGDGSGVGRVAASAVKTVGFGRHIH